MTCLGVTSPYRSPRPPLEGLQIMAIVQFPPPPAKRLVYVVDDEPAVVSSLAAIIQMSGFDVRAFTRPREAMEAALMQAPDILLSDVMMPEMDGVELAIQISLIHPGCKILLLSGHAGFVDSLYENFRKRNQFELLEKPLNPRELVEKVKRLFLESPPRARAR